MPELTTQLSQKVNAFPPAVISLGFEILFSRCQNRIIQWEGVLGASSDEREADGRQQVGGSRGSEGCMEWKGIV